jgi:hypothetical protein
MAQPNFDIFQDMTFTVLKYSAVTIVYRAAENRTNLRVLQFIWGQKLLA